MAPQKLIGIVGKAVPQRDVPPHHRDLGDLLMADLRTLPRTQGGVLPLPLPLHDWKPWLPAAAKSQFGSVHERVYSRAVRRCQVCGHEEFGVAVPALPGDSACPGPIGRSLT